MRVSHIINRFEQQFTLRTLIVNSVDNLTTVGYSNINSQRVHARLSALKENWERFSLIHDAINLAMTKLSNEDKEKMHLFLDHDSGITNSGSNSSKKSNPPAVFHHAGLPLNDLTTSVSTEAIPKSTNLPIFFHNSRLPRIDIPKFDGSPSEWLSFKDLFSSIVISNPTLAPVEKLHYLKTYLIGPASKLIKNTALSDDNFSKAWEALMSFYENKRLLVNSALHSLLNLKRMTKESAGEMEQLYTNLMQIHRTLETLRRPIQHWDDFFVFIAVQRLDAESVKAWEQQLGSVKEPPTWKQFSDFLVTRLLSLQAFEKSRGGKWHIIIKQLRLISKEKPKKIILASQAYYTSKSVPQRVEIIKKHNLCFNCLGPHRASACRITKRCLKCGRKHHTTIHQKTNSCTTTSNSTSTVETTDSKNSTSVDAHVLHSLSHENRINSGILLATAQVEMRTSTGETIQARALIDQGSEISLISERLVQLLHLPRSRSSVSLSGVGGQRAHRTKGVTHLTLKSHYNSSELSLSAYILPKLTAPLPSPIDILLGADVYHQIIENGLIKGDSKSPIAQLTKFGWIISGPVTTHSVSPSKQSFHISIDTELSDLLQRFWQLEEVSTSLVPLSTDEQECEQHFKTSHSRDHSGRYIVRLPFKKSVTNLGDSRTRALRIIQNLMKRFQNEPEYATSYYQFLREYESLGHMTQVAKSNREPEFSYYLPHHGVVRNNSLTTKLRVVFNGSSRTTSGISLNQILHTGAKLQTDVFNVLVWFRQFRYVFSCDIEKIYRQIQVHPDDRVFQRILWVNQDQEINTYELSTVTYGLACAPFLALRSLNQLVTDEGGNFPLAIPSLIHGRYVDDIFGGAHSLQTTQEIISQLISLCTAGGFPLQKWTSNTRSIFDSISPQINDSLKPVQFDESTTVHILGLCWNSQTDSFQFSLNFVLTTNITKRSILSTVAKIFDPLGLLVPVIITAKLLIQELWSIKLGWDETLPSQTTRRWIHFTEQFKDIATLTFPRWIEFQSSQSLEIHGFCDASQLANCATVYIRTATQERTFKTHLLCSKSKVAPLKRMTIPRLELTAAFILTKLVSRVLKILDLGQIPVILWTDSAIVHTWINNHPSRWKDFVHNRVCYIHENLPQAIWRFIPGKENPADIGTRGMIPSQLSQHHIWWSGPSWLQHDSSTWPKEPTSISQSQHLEERPAQILISNKGNNNLWELIYKYSKITRLFRITALCMRAVSYFKNLTPSTFTNSISTQELEDARLYWVRSIQSYSFHSEIKVLSKQQLLPRSNALLRLTPFVDSQGLLRVGDRLQSAPLSIAAKHPLILPRESPLTSLIISDAHVRTFHGGTQATMSFIRNNYWIVGGRAPVRSFILKCIKCARYRQNRAQQIMGQLPPERVTPSRPFFNSGVDYAGPVTLKNWKGRNSKTYKGYIALFVCLATSAVYIELVTDYTTDAFIAAYKRFVSRRGICQTLTSDCGTNLKGADTELKKLFLSSSKELDTLSALLANDGTQWKFIPPASPHFGGKWEAGVKSVKFHLKRVVGNHVLTYEEMTTMLTQIEAILNSRPLSSLTDDPDDFNVLTPAHFLIGSYLSTIPEPALETEKISRLSRWQLTRQMGESFWSHWTKEYLQRYLSIYKWNRASPPLREGTLVLVVDERYPPSKWPLGRIIRSHPGKDGQVRVVTVRMQASTFKRPIIKLCPLPNSS